MTYSPQQLIVWASGIGAAADANAIFGPYNNEPLWAHNAQQLNYRAHNPVDLVENLGPVDLTYYSGTDDDGQSTSSTSASTPRSREPASIRSGRSARTAPAPSSSPAPGRATSKRR
ncbi:hypothetical protein [Nannocystis pusilla]|uniref:hypothetical protein n=1 Tax=Nannocystis pusilla TaxID=889268 RepID=UPI003B7DED83